MKNKKAVLSVGNVLADVSLTTLAAIGGVLASPVLAGVPTALLATKEGVKALLAAQHAEKADVVDLEPPPFWVGEERSWQDACAEVEHRLPAITEATAQQLKQMGQYPTTEIVQRVFINQIGACLSPFIVGTNDRNLVAVYIAKPFLNKAATVLKSAVDPIQSDAVANSLKLMAQSIEQIAAAQAAPIAAVAAPASTSPDVIAPTPAELLVEELLEQKWQQEAYDVYLCYHKADVVKVMEINGLLKAEGILPWYDTLVAAPGGQLESDQDEQQIRNIGAVVVFIGKNAVKDWQALRVQAFLNQFVRRATSKVSIIPVFLPGAPESPEMSVFLELFVGVDFRQPVPKPFPRLLWGITGKRPPLSAL